MTDVNEFRSLEGFRCDHCGHISTTYEIACQSCHSGAVSKASLSGEGEVVSFTIVNVPSEAFAGEAPYAYVVVRLNEGCSISGWVPQVKSAGDISIGDRAKYSGKKGEADVFTVVRD